jgi:hypothetical protein
MNTITSLNLLVWVASITSTNAVESNTVTLEDATKRGLVRLVIKAKGGITGKVIEMNIKNISNNPIHFKIEAGRKLDSKNNNEQDILITQAQELIVLSKQEKSFGINGMCCQAHNSCPKLNSLYGIGTMADSNLIKMALYIDKNKCYENYTAQQAVWCISDNESIGGIYGGDTKMVNEMRNYVSAITGLPVPTYNITYKDNNGRTTIGHPYKIEGVFDYKVSSPAHVNIAIYDVSGKLVQVLFANLGHDKGTYKLYYTFRTKAIAKGIYYARALNDGVVANELKIEF